MRVIRAPAPAGSRPGAGVYEYHLVNAPNVARRLRAAASTSSTRSSRSTPGSRSSCAAAADRRWSPPCTGSRPGSTSWRAATGSRCCARSPPGPTSARCSARRPRDPFRRYLLREPRRAAARRAQRGPLRPQAERSARPTLVCAASLGDPRKRGAAARRRVRAAARAACPEARLLVCRRPRPDPEPRLRSSCPRAPSGVEPVQQPEQLAPAYAARVGERAAVGRGGLRGRADRVARRRAPRWSPTAPAPARRSSTTSGSAACSMPDDEADLARAMEEALELGAQSGDARSAAARRAADYDWNRIVAATRRSTTRSRVAFRVGRCRLTPVPRRGAPTLRRSLTTYRGRRLTSS